MDPQQAADQSSVQKRRITPLFEGMPAVAIRTLHVTINQAKFTLLRAKPLRKKGRR